jgi:PAS domain S-box-containing protein
VDSEFRFLKANPAFLTMFGYSNEELQQLSFLDICIDEALDQCRDHLQELSADLRPHYEIETQHRRKDGTFLPVNTYFSAISERRPHQRFLAVTVDISARRAAEDALHAAQSELGRVARLTTAGAMAATIAHEINQPLAAIVANGSAGVRWLDRPDPNLEEARSAFERVINEGHRAAQIITSIRAMFKKDSGARSPTAINELVCEVVATSLSELKSRRVFAYVTASRRSSANSSRSGAASAGTFEPHHECYRLDGFRARSSARATRALRASRRLGRYWHPRFRGRDQP